MKNLIRNALWDAGIYVGSRIGRERSLLHSDSGLEILRMVLQSKGGQIEEMKSQIGQDVVALILNDFKTSGYFVEFGATNGVGLSNSYLLEKRFGWKGILAEPMPRWHSDLRKNRNCIIETRCVWSKTGENLDFLDVEDGELSTISTFADSDAHMKSRGKSDSIVVETVSLADLLAQHNAPATIDYLSVDTEGSEFDILKDFPFNTTKFNFITIEHNYGVNRQKVRDLLQKNGYRAIMPASSRWDDWFVPMDHPHGLA